jgi:flagellin
MTSAPPPRPRRRGGIFTIEIAGALGSRELSFASGTTLAQIAAAINTFSDVTGVEARCHGHRPRASTPLGVRLRRVRVRQGRRRRRHRAATTTRHLQVRRRRRRRRLTTRPPFERNAASNGVRDSGQDIGATVNGVAATSRPQDSASTPTSSTSRSPSPTSTQALGAVNSRLQHHRRRRRLPARRQGRHRRQGLARHRRRRRPQARATTAALRRLGYLSTSLSGKSLNVVDGDLDPRPEGRRARRSARSRPSAAASAPSRRTPSAPPSAAWRRGREHRGRRERDPRRRLRHRDRQPDPLADPGLRASTNILTLANSQPQTVLQLLG